METDKRCWYIAVVRKNTEKRSSKELQQKGFNIFLPQNRQVHKDGSDSYTPLMPQYIFVQVAPGARDGLLKQKAVQHILHFGQQPCAVDEQTIDMIRLFTQHYHNIHVERMPVDLNAHPNLEQSPMHGIQGSSMSRKYALVRLYLPNLGAMLVAEGLAPEMVASEGSEDRTTSTNNQFVDQ